MRDACRTTTRGCVEFDVAGGVGGGYAEGGSRVSGGDMRSRRAGPTSVMPRGRVVGRGRGGTTVSAARRLSFKVVEEAEV